MRAVRSCFAGKKLMKALLNTPVSFLVFPSKRLCIFVCFLLHHADAAGRSLFNFKMIFMLTIAAVCEFADG